MKTIPSKQSAFPTQPPEAWEPLLRVARIASRPFARFLDVETSSGIVLLVTAGVALAWANSPWAASYHELWNMPIGISVGNFAFERTLQWLVDDGLMVVFFFVIGLEIRCELHHGALSEWRGAMFPVAAALGGMVVPAIFYLALAGAPASRSGWGVPMATDIAFAVGILALLGKRVPESLRMLLLALAVIDDLGAILVIAVFYSSSIDPSGLLLAALGIGAVFVMQWLGVRAKLAYIPPALVTWAGIYAAGIHPTIAGVLIGVVTPVRAWLGPEGFRDRLDELELRELARRELSETLRRVSVARREAMSPAENLVERLGPWVAFGIMPIFALANAGVTLSSEALHPASLRAAAGVAAGLILGKPAGIVLAGLLAIRLGVASLPPGVGVRHLVVLGFVAGVGFTMALFIAQLAFVNASMLGAAKTAVLAASAAAAILGIGIGRIILPATRSSHSRDEET